MFKSDQPGGPTGRSLNFIEAAERFWRSRPSQAVGDEIIARNDHVNFNEVLHSSVLKRMKSVVPAYFCCREEAMAQQFSCAGTMHFER